MICPACNEEMIVVEVSQIELDYCTECKGAWFDADELGLLLDSLGLGADEVLNERRATTSEKPRRCPYCRSKMEKTLIGPGDDVVVDKCRNGHGLWFDGGELETVIGRLRSGDASKTASGVGSFLADALLTDGDDTDNEQGEEE